MLTPNEFWYWSVPRHTRSSKSSCPWLPSQHTSDPNAFWQQGHIVCKFSTVRRMPTWPQCDAVTSERSGSQEICNIFRRSRVPAALFPTPGLLNWCSCGGAQTTPGGPKCTNLQPMCRGCWPRRCLQLFQHDTAKNHDSVENERRNGVANPSWQIVAVNDQC